MYRGELDRQFEQKETWEQRSLTGNIAEELSAHEINFSAIKSPVLEVQY
jgi:hypothetical protein